MLLPLFHADELLAWMFMLSGVIMALSPISCSSNNVKETKGCQCDQFISLGTCFWLSPSCCEPTLSAAGTWYASKKRARCIAACRMDIQAVRLQVSLVTNERRFGSSNKSTALSYKGSQYAENSSNIQFNMKHLWAIYTIYKEEC